MNFAPAQSLKAILGPTNTGKTYYAIDRMLAHRTGMIGLPLRLLAREVYQRVVEVVGPQAVALVTGEERIVPPSPRYWVATVEAMPTDIPVECLAIDEVQVATDFDRGHVFTNRILHARGLSETLLLGAATMAPVIRTLLPNAEIVHRPRLSQLNYAGSKKISRQPRRTAIVAFSAAQVYAIAELIRRERGGAAVVMGALSPRTRNAQVEIYQNGDVDFLVATDAIGMGLNLDVHHVAFADDTKFDGHQTRPLTPAEFAQIAGRAGRHTRNGTFGVTGGVEPFDEELVQHLETHEFAPVRVLQWRNPDLNFASIEALRTSLEVSPSNKALTKVPVATDQHALEFLARNEAAALAKGREADRAPLAVLPDPRLPRHLTGTARRAHHKSLFRPPEGGRRRPRLARRTGPLLRQHHRRYRYIVEPYPPGTNMDVRRQPQELACGPGSLARKDPGARGPPERCLARTPHTAFRRPADQCSHPSSERPTNGEPGNQ